MVSSSETYLLSLVKRERLYTFKNEDKEDWAEALSDFSFNAFVVQICPSIRGFVVK